MDQLWRYRNFWKCVKVSVVIAVIYGLFSALDISYQRSVMTGQQVSKDYLDNVTSTWPYRNEHVFTQDETFSTDIGVHYNHIQIKTNYSSMYHDYGNKVDLRIIILTFNRPNSLLKVLESLQNFVTDGYNISMEVWVDRDKKTNKVDAETINVIQEFRWTNGPINVWIHGRHVGLIGQWLYAWRPRLLIDDEEVEGRVSQDELALYVEDDVDISRYAYRWLRAIHTRYQERPDIACYALQDENTIVQTGYRRGSKLTRSKSSPVILYRMPGSWGMTPRPGIWRQFQDWYQEKSIDDTFRPYVKEAKLSTSWYKTFEHNNREDTFWTIWMIYFMVEHKIDCIYSNLPEFTGHHDVSLSYNRREPGLHYKSKETFKSNSTARRLMNVWKDKYVDFPKDPPMYNLAGRRRRKKKLNPINH